MAGVYSIGLRDDTEIGWPAFNRCRSKGEEIDGRLAAIWEQDSTAPRKRYTREAHYCEPGIMVIDPAWRRLVEIFYGSIGGAGGKRPEVAGFKRSRIRRRFKRNSNPILQNEGRALRGNWDIAPGS